jgi:hypothetical protein
MFFFCSYDAPSAPEPIMDNRINEIRKLIRALRLSMLEAEAIMREQVNQDLACAFVAEEILKMRAVMSVLVREREMLGDREPILVKSFFIPRRPPAAPRPLPGRPAKRVEWMERSDTHH